MVIIDMCNIDEIMDMLDWNNSIEVQQKGLFLAKDIKSINVFILPMHPECNKNVWENCAKILADKTDTMLNPYLTELLRWLEDLNWPGALIVMERLKLFVETELLGFSLRESVKIANAINHDMWLKNLSELLDNETLKKNITAETLSILKSYYRN